MIENIKILLASSSQSRKKILKRAGLNFYSKKPNIDETKIKKKLKEKKFKTKKITEELAKRKCLSIKDATNTMVVGCDTMVDLKGAFFDKPKNLKVAKKILKKLSGKKHFIYTSLYVSKNNRRVWSHTEKTTIFIRKLKEGEIRYYLKKSGKKILSSSGCYQAEGMGPYIFSEIKGDFYNIMGFPIIKFLNFLKKQRTQTQQ